MKFTIAKEDLQRELAFVQSVVERRNMIPVLANVLIESVSADSIRINGTDLDVTIRADVQVETMPTQGQSAFKHASSLISCDFSQTAR